MFAHSNRLGTLALAAGLALTAASASAAPAKPLKLVKVYFIEALAPRDSTSSERFQKDYEAAIEAGKRLSAKKLARCGYELETRTAFYDASDPLQAKEKAEQAVANGAWLLVGPRRSNHYLLLAQGAVATSTVSIMATASEVDQLGALHLSLTPSNAQMAKVAVAEAARLTAGKKNPSYLSVVSDECLACRDFADQFDLRAQKMGLKPLSQIKVLGDTPALAPILEQIKRLQPAFVVLPNYSKVSSYLMAAIRAVSPEVFFVGGDGWGDSNFGFVQNNPEIKLASGFSVRGLPPIEKGLAQFELGQQLSREMSSTATPYSGPALAILKTLDATTQLLCRSKPQNLSAFKASFEKTGRSLYQSPWGVSVYSLKGEKLVYKSSTRVR